VHAVDSAEEGLKVLGKEEFLMVITTPGSADERLRVSRQDASAKA